MGIGLGGFVDGIVLHQVLQWHHMLSDTADNPVTTVAGLEANTLADGVFHIASWLFVVAAMTVTLRAWQRRALAPPWRGHAGLLLAGWGIFNLLDTLNHILGFHHIRDDIGGPIGWDIGFFVFAVLLVAAGWTLIRGGRPTRTAPAAG